MDEGTDALAVQVVGVLVGHDDRIEPLDLEDLGTAECAWVDQDALSGSFDQDGGVAKPSDAHEPIISPGAAASADEAGNDGTVPDALGVVADGQIRDFLLRREVEDGNGVRTAQ